MMLLRHPTFTDVTRQVPDGDAARWEASGWIADRPSKPAAPKSKPSKPKPRTRKSKRD